MKCILGIGNPGREYATTRHNCGFMVIDALARRHGLDGWQRKWDAQVLEWRPAGSEQRVLLVKPQGYVNRSGEAAQAVLAFHKLLPADLLAVVDDINLPLGTLRLRGEGSAGGHNGLRDIEARIGQAYARLRLGVGAPRSPGEQIGHVLAAFAPDEQADAEAMIGKAADCAEAWAREGLAVTCRFNGPLHPPEPPAPRPPPPAAPPPPPSGA